jgi:hypothetical protein
MITVIPTLRTTTDCFNSRFLWQYKASECIKGKNALREPHYLAVEFREMIIQLPKCFKSITFSE